ncbi:hypothetical protein Bca52824_093980 [Brassica carinata]|uniref:Response regulatory domain-containing protein n=1 Tax=Brassica carinata TaxID=52824 RepID=A0A8X7P4G9_BRACI|nr:hypothetical protein Bca52824_093980 [Brassica carinata]
MDMDMLVMNGIQIVGVTTRAETLSLLGRKKKTTTRAEEEEMKEFIEAGLNDFQEKPLTISKLFSILHNLDFNVHT